MPAVKFFRLLLLPGSGLFGRVWAKMVNGDPAGSNGYNGNLALAAMDQSVTADEGILGNLFVLMAILYLLPIGEYELEYFFKSTDKKAELKTQAAVSAMGIPLKNLM